MPGIDFILNSLRDYEEGILVRQNNIHRHCLQQSADDNHRIAASGGNGGSEHRDHLVGMIQVGSILAVTNTIRFNSYFHNVKTSVRGNRSETLVVASVLHYHLTNISGRHKCPYRPCG